MKTPNALKVEINNLSKELINSGLAYKWNPTVISGDRDRTRVAYHRRAATHGDFGTIAEYRSVVAHDDFTCLLKGGGVLQISYDVGRRRLVGHRLGFYACPIDLTDADELLEEKPFLDVFDMYMDTCLRDELAKDAATGLFLRTPIRFDFDDRHESDDHPKCHLHLVEADCRWLVSAPVSLGHFVHFIFKHFYRPWWDAHKFLRAWPTADHDAFASIDETQLHISYRRRRLLARFRRS